MRARSFLALTALVGGLIPTGASAAGGLPATAQLMNAQGEVVAAAVLYPAGAAGVKVDLVGWKLSPGPHGVHIHTNGQCEGTGFASAGGHFNPEGKKHGTTNPDGPHAGDLPNLDVAADGSTTASFVDPRVAFAPGANSLFKPGGTALVIHADADDEKTDPAGNSGARIACGVITPGGASPVRAVSQSPEFAAMRARFEGLNESQVRALGYAVDKQCVTAANAGLPPEAGSMGFHAVNGRLYGQQFPRGKWDPYTPPILVLDASRRVAGVEWEGGGWLNPAPAAYGQTAPLLPGHEGPPAVNVPHHMLHAYFEPGGQVLFDVWNPNLTCPTQGHLNGRTEGSFATYEFDYPGDESVYTINLQVSPDDGGLLAQAGFRVYGPGGSVHVVGGAQPGLTPNVSANLISRNRGRHIVQVYNYGPGRAMDYELTLVRGTPEGQR